MESRVGSSIDSDDTTANLSSSSRGTNYSDSDLRMIPFVGIFIVTFEDWKRKFDVWMGKEIIIEEETDDTKQVGRVTDAYEDEKVDEDKEDEDDQVEGIELSVKEFHNPTLEVSM